MGTSTLAAGRHLASGSVGVGRGRAHTPSSTWKHRKFKTGTTGPAHFGRGLCRPEAKPEPTAYPALSQPVVSWSTSNQPDRQTRTFQNFWKESDEHDLYFSASFYMSRDTPANGLANLGPRWPAGGHCTAPKFQPAKNFGSRTRGL